MTRPSAKAARGRRRSRAPIDLTEGRPWSQILRFMLPMLLGNIAQQLYNTADSVIVGRYVGDLALAAVGSAGPVLNLLIVLLVGISTGAGIVVSQYQGARRRSDLEGAIGNCLILTALATLIVMGLSACLIRPMLHWMDTPQSIFAWCESYLRILLLGGAGMAYYNILGGVLRGLGDSLSALFYLLVACALNIALDLYFVAALHMGVSGAALATVIAQVISALLCLLRLTRMPESFELRLANIRWNGSHVRSIIRLGVPSGLTQVIMSMSFLLVQSLINRFGEAVIAANVIVMRVDGFVILPALSFCAALTTYAGQNIGAGRPDRVEQGLRQSCVMAVGVAALVTAALLAFGAPVMRLFTQTRELVALGMRFMRILAVGYALFFLTQCFCGAMSGAGQPMATMRVSVLATFAVRLPLAWLMVRLTRSPEFPQGRPEALYYSQLCAWLFGTLYSYWLYRKGKWRRAACFHEEKEE